MKTIAVIILSVLSFSCMGQNVQDNWKKNAKSIDTLSVLFLKNKRYGGTKYRLLQLCNLDNERYQIQSTSRIELTREHELVASTLLPLPDEIKNFSVTKIAETQSGFEISINWGGGNNIYDIEFNFTFRDNLFYLDKVETYRYGPNEEGTKTTKKISPQIPVNRFSMLDYIKG